jgi:hypothetical protein
MGRPSYTVEWINHPTLKIVIKNSDELWYGVTNIHGNAYTKIRAYEGRNATVIQGDHRQNGNSILVRKSYKIWSCKIYSAGKVSSIGIPNENVTVIIH